MVAATAIEERAGAIVMDLNLLAEELLGVPGHDNVDIAGAVPTQHQKTGIA